jgi:dihydrolipoamide dehydrogenase
MSKNFDVVVIGGGPAGYTAAIRAAQVGLSVACVDAWQNDSGGPALGGTCTNVGCIPSKALLQSSEHFEMAGHGFAEHGVKVGGLELDLAQMQKRKDKVVQQNNSGITYLFKKNKIASYLGAGSFVGKVDGGYEIKVTKAGTADESLITKHVIVATGSNPRALPGAPFDERLILSNTGALALGGVPKSLCLIGAGVIGLEMGSVWRRLGSEVTVLEALPDFLGAVDTQIAKEAKKAFDKQGLSITLGVTVTKVATGENDVTVEWTDAKGAPQKGTFDRLIVSIGRVPNTDGLNAEAVGLERDARGFIAVDDDCRTNLENVWGIGDVVRGPMLAHKGEEEGVAVAERIVGQKPHVDFNTVPWVIYTHPEIAWVGQTEQALKSAGREYKVGTFPFMANGRARALGDTTGMVKMIADAKTDEILGVHMVGPGVSELIAEAVVAMEFRAASEDIARICHAHPSLSEATKEAALGVDKRTLNF